MSTKFLSPGWRMPRNANQGKNTNYSLLSSATNNAINFNYTDEFMSGQNPWTLSLWVLWTSTPLSKALFFKGQTTPGGMVALYGDGGTVIKFMGNGSGNDFNIPTFQTPSSVTINKWYNLVITYDGNLTIKAYVDNTLDVTHTLGSPLNIGGGSKTNYFNLFQYDAYNSLAPTNALLSNLSIFDYALSPSQITTLYGDSTNGPGNPMALPSPPKAYYPLGTSAWNGDFLVENNAIENYVFNFDYGGGDKITSNINQSNTGGKFTVSIWANSASQLFRFTHGANDRGGFLQTNNVPLIYLSNTYFLYFNSNTAQTDGKWHHWVVFVDTTNITNSKIWVDKVQITQNYGTFTGSANSFTTGLELSNYSSGSNLGFLSNMMYFINYEIDQANVDKLYNYGSPLMSTATLTQAPNAWYKLDASEIYNGSSTEWEINDATAAIKTTALQNAPSSARLQASNVITNGSTAMSFSAWVYYPSSFGSGEYLRICNASQNMYVGSFQNNYVYFRNGGAFDATFNKQIVPGQWNHIVVSTEYVGSTWTSKLRLNGGTVDTQTGSGNSSISISSNNLDVTAWGYGNYSGSVLTSNSIIWDNKALTDSELLDVYNAFSVSDGVPTVQPNSISSFPQSASISGWYKLDNKPLLDSSGNNNTLLLSNGGTEIGPSLSNNIGKSLGMSQANLVQSNLQTVAPYSKYAMNFDGTDYIDITGVSLSSSYSISFWINYTATTASKQVFGGGTTNDLFWVTPQTTASGRLAMFPDDTTNDYFNVTPVINDGNWHNIIFTYDNSTSTLTTYTDGFQSDSRVNTASVPLITKIGGYVFNWTGKISNMAIWGYRLLSSQAKEIYNEGLPSNLNTFSGTAPVAWWQLGENSSYVGGATNPWTFLDEIGSNNGTSGNLPETALTNGVGTTANGVSNNMAESNLVGNAPYSTANAISSGMAVTARGTDVP